MYSEEASSYAYLQLSRCKNNGDSHISPPTMKKVKLNAHCTRSSGFALKLASPCDPKPADTSQTNAQCEIGGGSSFAFGRKMQLGPWSIITCGLIALATDRLEGWKS